MLQVSKRRFLTSTILVVAVLCATLFVFIAFSNIAFAQDLETVGTAAGLDTSRSISEIIGTIIGVFLGILGVLALIIVLYAGFLWMTAGGEEKQVLKAKQWLINGVIGLVIILSAFAITNFIFNALTGSNLLGGGTTSTSGVTAEALSGSLGSGALRDHYPERFDTDVARNTRIFVTFRDEMSIESFISGYDTAGTASDTSDDTVTTTLNVNNILIYPTAAGVTGAFSADQVDVYFTDDLKTFLFDPSEYLDGDSNYTVFLSDDIEDADGDTVVNSGGYEWTFTTGNEIDVTPPTIRSVIPRANGEYDRNISVQITFDEAVDPTSASGTFILGSSTDTFENIQIEGEAEGLVSGTFAISNGYKTVTFTSTDECGTNSCGETIYCLPGDDAIDATVFGADVGDNPPEASSFPYNGVADASGNSLDGDGDWGETDGEAGDDYIWAFTTTNDINLSVPEIETITPDISAEEQDLDQPVVVTFGCDESDNGDLCDSVMLSSTISADEITLSSSPEHELWYRFDSTALDFEDQEVVVATQTQTKTQAEVRHGTFLESIDDDPATDDADETVIYLYGLEVFDGVLNQYQNCFVPAEGPSATGARCRTTDDAPYCCSGIASSTACSLLDSIGARCGTTEDAPYCCSGIASSTACSLLD
ncbi:MAG: Ig-like domain-containing protein [Candidatus Uhrbacteria bacterium]|nr:Ig-like domain-containing protein [Candidatus Uhrbacteria bacterium]